MKKISASLLSICMVATLLSGCNSEEKPITTQAPQNDSSVTAEACAAATTPPETEAQKTAVMETVVYDADGIKITATGMEENALSGINLKFLVENSTDKNIAMSGTNFVVNDITISGYLYIDVAAGKKANGAVEFSKENLTAMNITDIATFFSGDSYIYDSDSYETICYTPFFVETTASESYTQIIDDSGDVLFDQNGITVITKNIKDDFLGQYACFLVKNNTGKDIICEGEHISVNGFTINAWMYDVIYADTVRLCEMELLSSTLEENGIVDIEEITFNLRVIEDQSYSPITTSGELKVFITK